MVTKPLDAEALRERFDAGGMAVIPALIMQNIELVPAWSDNVDLVTAHCHAYVLDQDARQALAGIDVERDKRTTVEAQAAGCIEEALDYHGISRALRDEVLASAVDNLKHRGLLSGFLQPSGSL